MLSIFRTNQLFTGVLLLLYAALLHVEVWTTQTLVPTTQGGFLYQKLLSVLPDEPIILGSIGVFVLFLQAFLLNFMEYTYRLDRELHLFPGVFYLLFTAYSPSFPVLSPVHFANFFLFFALFELMGLLKKTEVTGGIFNVGLLLGMAALFYPTYLIFILFAFIALNLVRNFNIRERFIILAGVLVVYYIVGSLAYLANAWHSFSSLQGLKAFSFFKIAILRSSYPITLLPWVLLLGIILINSAAFVQKRTMQTQKRVTLLFWLLLISIGTLPFQKELSLEHTLVLALPMGYLTAMWFFQLKKNWAELLHVLLLFGAGAIQWFLS